MAFTFSKLFSHLNVGIVLWRHSDLIILTGDIAAMLSDLVMTSPMLSSDLTQDEVLLLEPGQVRHSGGSWSPLGEVLIRCLWPGSVTRVER